MFTLGSTQPQRGCFDYMKKRSILITCMYHLFFVALFFCGQTAAFAQNDAYRIGPTDVLRLTIEAGGEQQNDVILTVSNDGTVNAPFVGVVKAAGLTPAELEKKIAEPLARDYFVDPEVNIYIQEYHSLSYHISGAVKKPGLYETSSQATLVELIALAEGVLPDRGKWAYIMRGGKAGAPAADEKTDKEPLRVDLIRLLDQGDMGLNLKLQPGDVVYIPLGKSLDAAESKLSVEGEVNQPGLYDFQPGITALSACIMAGGFDRFAAPNRTRIIRQKGDQVQVIEVDLNDVKEGKKPDIPLQPGDRIHVPESWL
jgi:polysaccharide export outer membrane protein